MVNLSIDRARHGKAWRGLILEWVGMASHGMDVMPCASLVDGWVGYVQITRGDLYKKLLPNAVKKNIYFTAQYGSVKMLRFTGRGRAGMASPQSQSLEAGPKEVCPTVIPTLG